MTIIVFTVVLIFWVFAWALCRAASDAERALEERDRLKGDREDLP